jgi:hypothetical protein
MMRNHRQDDHDGMGWGRFAAMIGTSVVVMFILMYQLVYSADHLFFSLNRLVASLAMGCVMTVIMLGFMWPMYQGKGTKIAVLVMAILGFIALVTTNRMQLLIGDSAFMQAMIPHHSIAINNAFRARLSDPRVRDLADRIIAAQVDEIAEMKMLLSGTTPPERAGAGDDTASRARLAICP